MKPDLPVQGAVDRHVGYVEYFWRRPVPPDAAPADVEEYLLDPPGGAFGTMPADPPAVRGVPFGLV